MCNVEHSRSVMRRYSAPLRFPLICHLFFALPIYSNMFQAFSLKLQIDMITSVQYKNDGYVLTRKLSIGTARLYNILYNFKFVNDVIESSAIFIFTVWLLVLLFMSGDVHPNPGPASTSSSSSSSSSLHDSFPFLNTLNLSKHLTFVHYNVQSIANKTDIRH